MSDIRIKMANDLRDMSDMVGDLHWMAAKAVEDLTKKEGEIAKRDEELAACRVAVENCELFRARIAELEARIVWLECEAQVNAAPVSEAKAQGVVMQSTDGGRNPRYEGLFDGETEEQRASRLNAAPVQQVSVPDGFERYRLANKFCEQRLVTDDHVRAIVVDAFASGYGFGIAANPAAPAADAGGDL